MIRLNRGSAGIGTCVLRSVMFVLIFIAGASTLHAQETTWEVDMDASTFEFSVRHIGFFEVEGVIDVGEGSLTFDASRPDSTKAHILLSVESIDTGNALRDKELVSEDFLDARRYPSIEFRSSSVQPDTLSDGALLITGIMSIYGAHREISISAVLKPDESGDFVTIKSEFSIQRHDYELHFGRASDGLVGKEVKITVDLLAKKSLL